MSQSQRRRFRRYEVDDLHGSLLFRLDVKVLNFSLSGMAVETAQQLKLGRIYTVRLEGEAGMVEVAGTVRWCHLVQSRTGSSGEPQSLYKAGITFEGTLTEKAAQLLDFMNEHVILSLEKRILGRFKLKPGANVELAVKYEFEVTKLSLSGMLVKTRLVPEMNSCFDMELLIDEKKLEVEGRIAFVERTGGTETEPESQLGVEFLSLDDERCRVLKEFINNELE